MSKRELEALAAEPVMESRFRTRKSLEPETSTNDQCAATLLSPMPLPCVNN